MALKQRAVPGEGRRVAERVTVRDIATEAGLSIATVSRVINAQGQVSEGARRRVTEAIARLGGPAPRPRPRLPKPELPVLVRCPYRLSDYFGGLVTSVAETLALAGRPVLLDVGDSRLSAPVLRELAAERKVAGAVLILPPEPVEDLA